MSEETKDKEMTPEERLIWLRERGVMVETPEERKLKQIKDIMNEKDDTTIDGEECENLTFVHVPHDQSLPMKELSMKVPKNRNNATGFNPNGDLLINELKPFFKALSKNVDMSLFQDQGTKTLGSSADGNDVQVSHEALAAVAEQGQVETFCLVQPMPSNKFQSVNIYLDEVGLLKRLPLNKRAADFAFRAGFNPVPKFYGDIFLGRTTNKPILKNLNFKLGSDTAPDSEWILNATMENLEYQAEMNKITGTDGDQQTQPSADGENGIAKTEQDGLYSWTQTDEEIEIVVPLGENSNGNALSSKEVKAGGLKVKYFPRKLSVSFREKEILSLALYASVDVDGCTWTLDIGKKATLLNVTCEKNDEIAWPRINK